EKEMLKKLVGICERGLYQVLFVIGRRLLEVDLEAYNLIKNVIFGDQIVEHTTIVRTRFPEFENEEVCTEQKKAIGENKEIAKLINECNGVVFVDNPPTKGRYADIAIQSRNESRKRLLVHLMSYCGCYRPLGVKELNHRV